MKKSIFYSVVVGTILLTQAGHTSTNFAQESVRKARLARNGNDLNALYAEIQAKIQILRGDPVAIQRQMAPALKIVHDRAVDLPMASPGVTKPANVTQGDFDALSRVPEFKRLSVQQQNQILTDLDGRIAGRLGGPGSVQALEIEAAVAAVVPVAVGAVVAPLQAAAADVAPPVVVPVVAPLQAAAADVAPPPVVVPTPIVASSGSGGEVRDAADCLW